MLTLTFRDYVTSTIRHARYHNEIIFRCLLERAAHGKGMLDVNDLVETIEW
jgi:hypothetical protein